MADLFALWRNGQPVFADGISFLAILLLAPAALAILLAVRAARQVRQTDRITGWLIALGTASMLSAAWWMPAMHAHREAITWRGDTNPRFWFASGAEASVDHVPSKIVRMSGGAFRNGDGGTLSTQSGFTAELTSHGWNLLVASEPWSSDWRVYWNGQRLPPVRVNGAFVGTFTPPGRGTIELRYRPATFDDACASRSPVCCSSQSLGGGRGT